MELAIQIATYLIAIPLQCLILNAMRAGAWRRYPFVFLYVLVDLLTNLLEIRPNLAHDAGSPAAMRHWALLYWVDEQIIQATLFLLVISLIYRATVDMRPRRILIAALVLGSVLVAALSALAHYSPDLTFGKWMTRWTRDMNFCAAILDLGLWATLLRARKKDYTLLMVAGALGLQFTAGAVGQALRDISHATVGVTTFLIVAANLTCLYIWWQTFRMPSRRVAH
jgi:intracellular septation protein A